MIPMCILRGCLAVCYDTNKTHWTIWLMKEYGVPAIAPSGKLVLFNLNDGSIHFPNIDSSGDGLSTYPPLSQHKGLRVFHLYHETLVSPSHFGLPTCSSEMRLIKPTL
ncbi:hypothetical protein PIB30_096751 [Stylosanthes scabra]|uniref:Uncharacterized protein n=1 Tax=Stylosanthes scabra TaxID=79078 RepID=A0ABU6XWU4_9FABA|nr:hypothetical protein [Stylosanthes scabra]